MLKVVRGPSKVEASEAAANARERATLIPIEQRVLEGASPPTQPALDVANVGVLQAAIEAISIGLLVDVHLSVTKHETGDAADNAWRVWIHHLGVNRTTGLPEIQCGAVVVFLPESAWDVCCKVRDLAHRLANRGVDDGFTFCGRRLF